MQIASERRRVNQVMAHGCNLVSCAYHNTSNSIVSGIYGFQRKYISEPGIRVVRVLIKSNCVRPPHPKGWGMLMGRTPGFLGIVKYPLSYTHLRAHETRHDLVCRLLLEKKNIKQH